jgi:hypothetical protein
MGTKRASPGDSRPKPPLDAEQLALLEALKKDSLRIQLQLHFDRLKAPVAHYEKRRSQLKKIPQLWFAALSNHTDFALQWLTHPEDVEALKHLEDIWVIRHEPDPRAFTLEMVSPLFVVYFTPLPHLLTIHLSILKRILTSKTKFS